MQALLALLQEAGHSDFRDARGPMGFTQRQAGGKFTRDEADAFIAQLEGEGEMAGAGGAGAPRCETRPVARATADRALQSIPSERLAAELQRRGWVVLEP